MKNEKDEICTIKEYFKIDDVEERNKKAEVAIGKLICKLASKDSCGKAVYTYLEQ